MANRLAIAALSALVAMIALTLQGCGGMSKMAGKGTAKMISYYCATGSTKFLKTLEVQKSRKVNAICHNFKTNVMAQTDHTVKTDSSEHTMGIDAHLEIYCYGEAAKAWEKETLKAIHEEEMECVSNLTAQVKNISASKVGEWTTKVNALISQSYALVFGVRSSVLEKFETSLDATLKAVDRTAEGVKKIHSSVMTSVEHVVEDVCSWVNDDYLGKLEIALNKTIAKACDATKQFSGEINRGVNGGVEAGSGKATGKTSLGIDASVAIRFEHECVEQNAGDAETILQEQTEKLTQECTKNITDSLKGTTVSITTVTKLAHDFIEGQRPELVKIEDSFNVKVTTLLQMQEEYHAGVDEKTEKDSERLFALPRALPGWVAGTGASTLAIVGAGVGTVAALLAVAIRYRAILTQETHRDLRRMLSGYDQDFLETGTEEQ